MGVFYNIYGSIAVMNRKRRSLAALVAIIAAITYMILAESRGSDSPPSVQSANQIIGSSETASGALDKLEVKGRAPKTGYSREAFGGDWAEINGCDVRNLVLQRDLKEVVISKEDGCTVLSGLLDDPYTKRQITFVRGANTSSKVQIDHIVALSDAWQKGARQLSSGKRYEFANDSLNLIAVDGPTNMNKGDGDAATWLPPNKEFRCRFVARQVAVKLKYLLWVTEAEKAAIERVLRKCPGQMLPKASQ